MVLKYFISKYGSMLYSNSRRFEIDRIQFSNFAKTRLAAYIPPIIFSYSLPGSFQNISNMPLIGRVALPCISMLAGLLFNIASKVSKIKLSFSSAAAD